jgi:chromosome segregation ATPase
LIPVREGNEGAFRDGNDRASRKGNEGAHDRPLIKALEAHVETLKSQLAAAEARIDKQADDLVAYDTAYAAGLAAERAKVEAERAKAERMIAEFAARDAQHAADLAGERARTEKAIAAFASLADRLDQLAAERRPWWRRLVG